MQELRFTEEFVNGQITVHLQGPLSTQTYDELSGSMERIRKQLVALIVPTPTPILIAPQGAALDPIALKENLPGVDPTDRRRGPRAKKIVKKTTKKAGRW